MLLLTPICNNTDVSQHASSITLPTEIISTVLEHKNVHMFLDFHGGDFSDLVLWVVTPCCFVTFEALCSYSFYILFENNSTISNFF